MDKYECQDCFHVFNAITGCFAPMSCKKCFSENVNYLGKGICEDD